VALLLGTLFLPTALQAANGTWTNTGSTSANWSDTSNWSGGTVPGATSGTTSADVATFSSALGTYGTLGSPIVIDAGRNLGGMVFTNSAGAYTVGTTSGEVLLLSSGGMIRRQALSTASNAITINAPLRLYGNYTIYNDNNDSGDSASAARFPARRVPPPSKPSRSAVGARPRPTTSSAGRSPAGPTGAD